MPGQNLIATAKLTGERPQRLPRLANAGSICPFLRGGEERRYGAQVAAVQPGLRSIRCRFHRFAHVTFTAAAGCQP